jgi:hypothetical protein
LSGNGPLCPLCMYIYKQDIEYFRYRTLHFTYIKMLIRCNITACCQIELVLKPAWFDYNLERSVPVSLQCRQCMTIITKLRIDRNTTTWKIQPELLRFERRSVSSHKPCMYRTAHFPRSILCWYDFRRY